MAIFDIIDVVYTIISIIRPIAIFAVIIAIVIKMTKSSGNNKYGRTNGYNQYNQTYNQNGYNNQYNQNSYNNQYNQNSYNANQQYNVNQNSYNTNQQYNTNQKLNYQVDYSANNTNNATNNLNNNYGHNHAYEHKVAPIIEASVLDKLDDRREAYFDKKQQMREDLPKTSYSKMEEINTKGSYELNVNAQVGKSSNSVLQVNNDQERIICKNCGAENIVPASRSTTYSCYFCKETL